ncbi:hypothetical protein WDW86_18155 [Bdellovibrionota bacterium FG-2]
MKQTVFLLCLFLILSACAKKKEEVPAETTPSLPPITSMVLPAEDISAQNQLRLELQGVLTTSNFSFASLDVAVWNLLINVGLAVPVAAFQATINSTPAKKSAGI